jgi:hypothetical protein
MIFAIFLNEQTGNVIESTPDKKWNESNYIFLNLYQLHLNSCVFLSNKKLFFSTAQI